MVVYLVSQMVRVVNHFSCYKKIDLLTLYGLVLMAILKYSCSTFIEWQIEF